MIRLFTKTFLLLIFLISHSFSQIINKIDIVGNKRISKETILVLGNLNIGNNYNDNELNNSIKKLYETNFFKEISLNFDNSVLSITLIENPIIEDIQIEGIKRTSVKESILEKMSLKNRTSFTESALQKDIITIKNFLKTNGYFFADVISSKINNENLNSVRLKLDVTQGSKSKINKISFIGDKKIKDKKLLDVIVSEEHKFWKFVSNTVYLNENLIDLDKRLLENYYKNLGFYGVKVLSSFAEFDKNGNFNLIYNISAGDYHYFNDLKLNLPLDYNVKDFDKIKKTFTKLKGKKFSLNDLNQILSEIDRIASLRLYDFIDAEVDEEIVDNDKINLTFKIKDSNKFYVEKINILGNHTTIEEVVRNKLIVDEGDPLNTLLYNKSIDNIKSLGIFKKVNGEVKDGSTEDLKIIDIEVEEKPTGEISLAAGVGTSGSTIGGGITEKNFLGKGINLRTVVELSEDSIKGEFVYSKPNFAYTENTLFTSLNSTTNDHLSDYGYKDSELGFSLGTEFEQYENLFFSPTIKTTLQDLETNSNASSSIKKQEGNYTDFYLNYGLVYDLRDSGYRPTSGNRTSFYQELPFVSNFNEINNTFVFTQYKPLNRESDMIGKASIYLNAINSLDDNVRISKRAYVPYNRLRGFVRGQVGPVEDNLDYIGGNYVAAFNMSTNLPNLLRTLEIADFSLFLDVANVWGVDYDSSMNDSNAIRSSTGIAMDLATAIGPLSFSLSQSLSKKSTDKTETFRFNLGTTF
jgi:outer membrane protein insertion porin family